MTLSSTTRKQGQRGCAAPFPCTPNPRRSSFAPLRETFVLRMVIDDSEHLLHNHRVSVASLRLLFTFAPERRSASLRNRCSPSPEYPRIPIFDAQPIPPAQLEEIMQTLAEAIRRGAVLLICAAGMSRSPIMAAAWMHRNGHLDCDAAMQPIWVLRPTIDPSPILMASVRGQLSRWGEQTLRK